MTGKLAAGSGPSVPPVVSITCLGSGLARGGEAGLRFNYARLSLDAVQVWPPFRTDYSTQPEAGGDPSERDRSEPKLGTKHVEAVVLIWQPAADWRHYQWCPTLAPRAFSHENRAEVSRVSVRDYSRIEQQRAPKSNGLQPQYSGSQFKFLHKLNGNIRPKFVDSKPSANLFGTTRSCVTKLSANFLPHPPSQQKMDQGWLLLSMG